MVRGWASHSLSNRTRRTLGLAMTPHEVSVMQALIAIVCESTDQAGNFYCPGDGSEPKAVKEARLCIALAEAEEAGQKLAGLKARPIGSTGLEIGYARTAKGQRFYRPVSRKRDR